MKTTLSLLVAFFISSAIYAQYDYIVSDKLPFGKANPEAPQQVRDFEPLIGICQCKSTTRKQDGTWNEPEDIIWSWKYILNGMGVQDETLKPDGSHSGSIRQYIADSSRWYVHWYSSKAPSTSFPTWEGNKKDNGNIVLYREQKAPNGMDGYYRLTFYDISKAGFNWIGEWVDKSEKVVFPTWKIECTKASD